MCSRVSYAQLRVNPHICLWGLRVLHVTCNLHVFTRKTRNLQNILSCVVRIWMYENYHNRTRTFDAHIFFILDRKSCTACFSNSHTSECGLRRQEYPINSAINIVFLSSILFELQYNYNILLTINSMTT